MPQRRDAAERLRSLPAIDRVIDALGELQHAEARAAARAAVDEARRHVLSGAEPPGLSEIVAAARAVARGRERALLQPVINATGVLLHTNLGRAPLGADQLDAVVASARGYSNLEYGLERGRRGSRYEGVRHLLRELTGAEDCIVVNNNAAAVLVTLAALAAGRKVLVSRGELVEIGGQFRMPDVVEASGARLHEVGTTNRTRLTDYERAATDEAAAVLKVHRSNFRIVGFTADVSTRELAQFARARGLAFVYDLGSGLVGHPDGFPEATSEPTVDVALSQGADVVTFSGDKLFAGPQAGVIAGRAELVERIAGHPLMRAVRVDKMTLAALQATARAYLDGAPERLPLWALVEVPSELLERRAHDLAALLDADLGDGRAKVEVHPSRAVAGGGALPGAELASWAITLAHERAPADAIARQLRMESPPVIARIEDERVFLDLRTVPAALDVELHRGVRSALRRI